MKEKHPHCWVRRFENVQSGSSTDVEVSSPISLPMHPASILARIYNDVRRFAINFELKKGGENQGIRKQECEKTGSVTLHRSSFFRMGFCL